MKHKHIPKEGLSHLTLSEKTVGKPFAGPYGDPISAGRRKEPIHR